MQMGSMRSGPWAPQGRVRRVRGPGTGNAKGARDAPSRAPFSTDLPPLASMLSAHHLDVIEATAPVLADTAEDITRHFYGELLANNPGVRPMFSPAHQRGGQQPRALADAVIAFAQNVRQLEALGPAVERIGHKHVALGVRPEHYPIVGAQLLASIRAVLGDAATDEVIEAWGAAYGVLTAVLTGREAELYDAQRERHGWSGFRRLTVQEKIVESDCVTSFVLADPAGHPLPRQEAGQYVTLRLPTPDGSTTMRTYSLSAWDASGRYRISVKRELAPAADVPAGFGSGFLHDEVEAGHEIEVAPPTGEFFLPEQPADDGPLVFLAGGVGVTPLAAMMQCAAEHHRGREVLFVQAARTRAALALGADVEAAAERHGRASVHVCLSDDPDGACDSRGLIGRDLLEGLLPAGDATVYLCGPGPFMGAMQRILGELGVAPERIHSEAFGPLVAEAPAQPAAVGS